MSQTSMFQNFYPMTRGLKSLPQAGRYLAGRKKYEEYNVEWEEVLLRPSILRMRLTFFLIVL